MPPTTYAWSVDLLMEMDPSNNGRIMYTVQNGNFDAPPTVQPVDQSAWDRFLNAIGGAIQDFVKDPGDIRETLDSQILGRIVPALTQSINTVNGFIFPGGASFLFKNPAFSNSDDLVANITYMTPAAKSGGASLIEKTSPYNLETSTELMKSHKASHTLSDQSDFQVLQNAQGLSLFFGISDTNVLYLSMERTNISTGWTPMDLTAELAVNFPGKTVTATNLAAACAKFEGRKTLLLDLDLQFGDAAIMLGVEPEKTIYDLVVAPGELDSEKLAGYTTKHACGLEVLPAPLRPEDAELVTEAKLGRLLEVARQSFDVIVVDTSPFFHGPMLATLDRTDELLLLCSLDVPTLKNLRLALQTLDLLSFPKQRVRIVLNRSNSKVGMKPNEVEGALGMKVRFEIPSDRAVPLAVNRGNPVVLAEESADVSRAIKTIAKEMFRAPKEEQGKRRRLIPALTRA